MKTIEISPKTIFTVFGIIAGVYLVILLKDLLFALLISFILLSALNPAVKFLTDKKGWKHSNAVTLVFFGFIGLFVSLIVYVLPVFIMEVIQFIKNVPEYTKALGPSVNSIIDIQSLTSSLPNVANQALNFVSGFASNIVFLISTLFFTYYFLSEEHTLVQRIITVFPEEYHEFITKTFTQIQKRMSAWFWGEISLMLIIGLTTFILLTLFQVKYALPLAVIAGLLEVVPTVGPIVSAIPAILVTLSNPEQIVVVIIGYVIIQQLENNLIVPQIMKKAVGMSPIFILSSLFIGGRLAGILGVLLALPVALLLETIVLEWYKHFPRKRLA
jgi:predicted PurR-regulated permease PerM